MNSSAGKGGREEGAVLPIVLIVVCVFLLFMTAVSSEVPVQNKTGRSYSEYFGTKLAVSGVLSMAQAEIARDPEWSGSLLYEANGLSAKQTYMINNISEDDIPKVIDEIVLFYNKVKSK